MTIERRIVVGLEDVTYIIFQCEKCPFRMSMSPDEIRQIPENCSGCGHNWIVGEQEGSALPPLKAFTKSLEKLRLLIRHKSFGFKILFEFEEPKDR